MIQKKIFILIFQFGQSDSLTVDCRCHFRKQIIITEVFFLFKRLNIKGFSFHTHLMVNQHFFFFLQKNGTFVVSIFSYQHATCCLLTKYQFFFAQTIWPVDKRTQTLAKCFKVLQNDKGEKDKKTLQRS